MKLFLKPGIRTESAPTLCRTLLPQHTLAESLGWEADKGKACFWGEIAYTSRENWSQAVRVGEVSHPGPLPHILHQDRSAGKMKSIDVFLFYPPGQGSELSATCWVGEVLLLVRYLLGLGFREPVSIVNSLDKLVLLSELLIGL